MKIDSQGSFSTALGVPSRQDGKPLSASDDKVVKLWDNRPGY
jgi:hypothetical protein